MSRLNNSVVIILLLILITILSSYSNFKIYGSSLSSPDEVSNYLTTRQYAKNGEMYFESKYLLLDEGNNLHFRGLINYNNKTLLFNFLGIPLFYRVNYIFLQDISKMINLILLAITLLITLLMTRQITNQKKNIQILTFFIFFCCIPIIYFMNKPYHSVIPSLVFSILFIYYLIKFNKSRRIICLYLSILFAFIAIWFRYEYLIFISLFIMINLIKQKKCYSSIKNKFGTLLILLFIALIVFIIPIFYLNYYLYGHPFNYGYKIFAETYYKNERAGTFIKEIRNVLFPSQKFNFILLRNNLVTIIVFLSPVFFILFFLSFIKDTYKKIGIYWLLIFYLLIYAGSSDTYLSGSEVITANKAVGRYWIILCFFMIFPAITFLKQKYLKKQILFLVIFFLTLYSTSFVSSEFIREKAIVEKYENGYNNLEKSSYVISGMSDKFLIDKANPITWHCNTWNVAECVSQIDYEKLSKLITSLLKNDEKVYFPKKLTDTRVLEGLIKSNVTFYTLNENFSVAKLEDGFKK